MITHFHIHTPWHRWKSPREKALYSSFEMSVEHGLSITIYAAVWRLPLISLVMSHTKHKDVYTYLETQLFGFGYSLNLNWQNGLCVWNRVKCSKGQR